MKSILLISLLLGIAAVPSEGDPLDGILDEMDTAACCQFEFLSILESEVFASADSASGLAYIAQDGRYRVSIGQDLYLQTEDMLYSYSRENNQVTVEKVEGRTGRQEEIPFITRLDEFYDIVPVTLGEEYDLTLAAVEKSSLPERMRLFIDTGTMCLRSLEFRDINDDLNRIVFVSHSSSNTCDSALLSPNFPDSVQVIRLY